jgi:hypothetical protein
VPYQTSLLSSAISMHSVCPIPQRLTMFSLQALRLMGLSLNCGKRINVLMVAIFVNDERFCCASKSYEFVCYTSQHLSFVGI